MITIEEAARRLGLTPRQVYRRISAARRELSPYLRKGRNGVLLLDEAALEIFRVAEGLRKASGAVIAEAIAEAIERLSQNGNGYYGDGRKAGGKLAESQRKTAGNLAETQGKAVSQGPLWAIVVLLGILAVEGALIAAALWR